MPDPDVTVSEPLPQQTEETEKSLPGPDAQAQPEPKEDPAREVLGRIARRYRIAPDAYGDMLAFLELDECSLPAPLLALGLKPDGIRLFRLMETGSALRARREAAQNTARGWQTEAEACGIDLNAAVKDPDFVRLLKAGFGVKDAFRRARAGQPSGIGAAAQRPPEPGAVTASRCGAFSGGQSRAEREAIERRALRGEKVRI